MEKKCHLIGIGGIGMSGLARIMLKQGIHVTGSDIATSYVTEGLQKEGAEIYIGHSEKYIAPGMTVVYNTDIKKDNPEYQAAIQLKCTLLHRSDLLKDLMTQKQTLLIAGTHGKTTTTSLLTWVLIEAGLDPSFAVGGIVNNLQLNARSGKGDYFVAEADESDGTFLKYPGYGAIVTNIGLDHMEHYKSESAIIDAFKKFITGIESKDFLFWCGDDTRLKKLHPKGISYGFGKENQLKASNFYQEGWNVFYDVEFKGKKYLNVEVSLTGKHNALNSLAIFGLAINLGISEEHIRKAFKSFNGVKRRVEKKGEIQNILFLDDYAHFPTEIVATLKAIRNAVQERRLIVVHQPHRYTRTRDCLDLYPGIFNEADVLFITDLYSANETPIPGVSTQHVIEKCSPRFNLPCSYVPRENLAETLANFVRPHDVVVTLGAGDITKAGPETLALLKTRGATKLKIGLFFGGRSVEHAISLQSATTYTNAVSPYLEW